MSSAFNSLDDAASSPSSSSATYKGPKTANNLLDLPDEVLVLIFQQLQPSSLDSTFPPRFPSSKSYTELTHSWTLKNELPWPQPASKPLCAVARVCRRTNLLATPLLYHAVTLLTIASTNKLSLSMHTNPSLGPLIRHLNLPNDGLLHGSSDRMADKESWLLSLQTILYHAWRLESVSISTRPGGEALQQLFRHSSSVRGGMARLRRITVSSLSFSFPILGAAGLEAPSLTHIHLIQWLPPTLIERFGSNLYNGLQVLRLSRIPASTFRMPVDIFLQSKGLLSAQQIFDQCINTSPQPLFLLLRECVEQFTQLKRILLEFEQLADLDTPEGYTPRLAQRDESVSGIAGGRGLLHHHPAAAFIPSPMHTLPSASTSTSTPPQQHRPASTLPTSTGGFGAPFDQFAPGQLGQLASLDFPADVPLSPAESQEWARRAEEDRCRDRRQHWFRLAQFKVLLIQYAREMRDTSFSPSSSSSSSSPFAPLQVRIVAARPLGWDRNDSLVDFHANARACQIGVGGGGGGYGGGAESDLSAFQDRDMYDLVKQYPHLGYDFANDGAGNKVAYWTGALPHPDDYGHAR